MEAAGISANGGLAMDLVNRSIESMNGVIRQATDADQDLAGKMIRLNSEQKVQTLQEEGVGQALNLLA